MRFRNAEETCLARAYPTICVRPANAIMGGGGAMLLVLNHIKLLIGAQLLAEKSD
jgi:hypothetical protein